MAQKLHDDYKFNYDNVKVLLGGWNTWKQENAKDPNAYPIEPTSGASGSTSGAATKNQGAGSAPKPQSTAQP